MSNSNVWLETQGKRVTNLIRDIEVYRAKGTSGELNLGEIIALYKGAIAEITRLQKELVKSEEMIKELNKQTASFFERESLENIPFPESKSE